MPQSNAFIIGASRGLGKAFAIECIVSGYHVTTMSRSQPLWAGVHCIHNPTVILDDFAREGVSEKYLTAVSPDILVLCVARGLFRSPSEVTDTDVMKTIMATFTANLIWLNAAVKLMTPGSQIVYVSSLTAIIPDENWAVYASCKSGVVHFIECIRTFAQQRDISITVIYPGCLDTQFHLEAGTVSPPEAVSPEDSVAEMLAAIRMKEKNWAAPMDREIVHDFLVTRERLFETYSGRVL